MFSRGAGSVGECGAETAAGSSTVPGFPISLAGFKPSTVSDIFGLAIDVQGKVLVETVENPEGTIVRVRKWRFVAVTSHIHVGGRTDLEIRREVNSTTAMPSRRNKLEVLRRRMQECSRTVMQGMLGVTTVPPTSQR